MLISKVCIMVGGILSLFMAVFHSRFYKLFNWKKEFARISSPNQRIFFSIHIALILLFLAFSFLSFTYTGELARCSGLALGTTAAYSLFWLWRTIWQVIYFKPPINSNAPSTRKFLFLHCFLIVIFTLLFLVYLIPVILKLTKTG